jgi:hypothetical protein
MERVCGREKLLTSWPRARERKRDFRPQNSLRKHVLNDLKISH